ncbi:hypothetical protein MVES_001298 [Malassezia vespertilionis]|uniref:Uncharacterized protein n=1 Tax=Malassezia vespertilionis TaxID=2020962 RepID=A0A2N1JE65_9BASI|nr:hypothetical protein MVES_001298 [Malassezia vespertilionis]
MTHACSTATVEHTVFPLRKYSRMYMYENAVCTSLALPATPTLQRGAQVHGARAGHEKAALCTPAAQWEHVSMQMLQCRVAIESREAAPPRMLLTVEWCPPFVGGAPLHPMENDVCALRERTLLESLELDAFTWRSARNVSSKRAHVSRFEFKATYQDDKVLFRYRPAPEHGNSAVCHRFQLQFKRTEDVHRFVQMIQHECPCVPVSPRVHATPPRTPQRAGYPASPSPYRTRSQVRTLAHAASNSSLS